MAVGTAQTRQNPARSGPFVFRSGSARPSLIFSAAWLDLARPAIFSARAGPYNSEARSFSVTAPDFVLYCGFIFFFRLTQFGDFGSIWLNREWETFLFKCFLNVVFKEPNWFWSSFSHKHWELSRDNSAAAKTAWPLNFWRFFWTLSTCICNSLVNVGKMVKQGNSKKASQLLDYVQSIFGFLLFQKLTQAPLFFNS